jgi:phage/conjugal plasmid C-4 type zinc finger TraR family protein
MGIEIESLQHSNIEEAEMGQIHALHLNENAIAAVRSKIPTGISLEECEDCSEEIPNARRIAIQGCTRCISCQEFFELKNRGY